MLLGDFLRLLRRHPRILIIGLVLTVVAAFSTIVLIKPTYKATASVLIVPSVIVPGITGPVNPFQGFGNSTTQAGRILQIEVLSPQSVQGVVAQGGADKYTVVPDGVATGPVLDISAESGDAATALLTVKLVVDKMSSLLDERQRQVGAPTNTFLRIDTISSTPRALPQHKTAIQTAIIVSIAVVVLTGIVILLAERLTRRRTPVHADPSEPALPASEQDSAMPPVEAQPDDQADAQARTPRSLRPGHRRHTASTSSVRTR